MDKTQIENHYKDVKSTIESAMESAFNVQVKGDDENAFVQQMKKEIEKINEDFKTEIDVLEKSAEWEKFCISFFGETNAGKSTLIDSLRIIYDEESRLSELLKNRSELLKIVEQNSSVSSKLKDAIQNILTLAEMSNKKIEEIEKSNEDLKKEIEEIKSNSQKEIEETKSNAQSEIAKEKSSSVVKMILGIVIGAGLCVAANFLKFGQW